MNDYRPGGGYVFEVSTAMKKIDLEQNTGFRAGLHTPRPRHSRAGAGQDVGSFCEDPRGQDGQAQRGFWACGHNGTVAARARQQGA